MNRRRMRPATKRSDGCLNVRKVVKDFQREEAVSSHRKGTFKIDKPFDEGLKAILKAKPQTGKSSKI